LIGRLYNDLRTNDRPKHKRLTKELRTLAKFLSNSRKTVANFSLNGPSPKQRDLWALLN
jgi:hypothetical protein